MASNSFGTQDQLTVDDETYIIHRLARIDGAARLPHSLKVLLENLLRNEDRATGHRRTDPRTSILRSGG